MSIRRSERHELAVPTETDTSIEFISHGSSNADKNRKVKDIHGIKGISVVEVNGDGEITRGWDVWFAQHEGFVAICGRRRWRLTNVKSHHFNTVLTIAMFVQFSYCIGSILYYMNSIKHKDIA